MRQAVASGLGLAQTVVTHFGQPQSSLAVDASDSFDYEYVLDCKPTAQTSALAIALSNMKVQLRTRDTLALEYEFHAHNNSINEIWASEVTPWSIATCSSDEYVKFWDLRSRLPSMVIPVGEEVWSLSVGSGDTLLATGTDEKVMFYDVRMGTKLGEYGESHVDAVTKVRFHPTQTSFVVTASEDGVVCFFDCRISDEDDAIESILNVESAVTQIGFFGPQMENIFCLTGTETLDLWNLQTAERIHHYETLRADCNNNGVPTDYLIDCVYDSQSAELFLLAGNHEGNVNVLNIGGGSGQLQHVAALQGGHKACVRCVYYDAAQATLYSGGEDARLCKWAPIGAAAPSTPSASQGLSSLKMKAAQESGGLKKARKSSRPSGFEFGYILERAGAAICTRQRLGPFRTRRLEHEARVRKTQAAMSVIIKKVTDFYKKDECSKYYKLGKTLGTGSFATVKSAISKADNSHWAVKCIDKASLTAEDEEALRVEVEVLQLVHHPNIVQLREVFDCQKTFYMVMEEMSGGELFDRIVEKEKYSEKEASNVVKKLAAALLYCHNQGIAHRDLKPENLLYQSTSEDAEIKIADFGLAKLIKGDSLMQTACGTPGYVAPEILEGRPYGAEVDLWSLGVITYILLCGFPPFYDENNAALFASIKSGVFDFPSPYWDCVSASAKDLISRLLVVDPRKRFDAQQVLDHSWISEIHNVSDDVLPHFTAEMKRYNARRRFRAGIMAAKTISALSGHVSHAISAPKTTMEAPPVPTTPETGDMHDASKVAEQTPATPTTEPAAGAVPV